MADAQHEHDGDPREAQVVPPASEHVHLPGPSYLPVVCAAGLTLSLVGVVISYTVAAIGLIITVVSIFRWIRETRADMAELPLEH